MPRIIGEDSTENKTADLKSSQTSHVAAIVGEEIWRKGNKGGAQVQSPWGTLVSEV